MLNVAFLLLNDELKKKSLKISEQMESKLLGLQALAAYIHFVVKVVALGGRTVGEEVAEPYRLGVWLVQVL